jgi:hypothetical protein
MVGRWWGAQIIEKNTDNPKYILYWAMNKK